MKWVFIPLFGCIISVVFVSGLSGYIDWRITVISSNFAAILLIITMSMTIHLAVRYRELNAKNFNAEKKILFLKQFITCLCHVFIHL